MKHSNPQVIDHSKEDIYQALTGKTEKLGKFVAKHLTEIMDSADAIEASGDKDGHTVSNVLLLIMNHPDLEDEEKMILAAEYGRGKGIKHGAHEVCSHCAIGPASKLIHSFIGNGLEGKP
jgi:hypothetical protein